jgi:hypothetical protein
VETKSIGTTPNMGSGPSNQAVPTQSEIPTLETVSLATVATFGAFKLEERFSFVRPYSPQVCVDIPGFRHSVARYRNTDEKVASKPAKLCTVPQLVLPEEYELLDERARKVILGVFEDEQDLIIKNLIDEHAASTVAWEVITLDKVLDSLTAVRLSKRLTKEQIDAWFKIACKDVCTVRATQIAEAKGFNAEQTQKQIAGTMNAYCALACKLAAPVPNMGQGEATALQNLLFVGKLEDDMAKVLKAKLHAILNPKIVEQSSDL